uniref:exodeoxyribonuclease VII large subunit n=1 Tax=Thaumasiovibrio occultus TaxID=1891184 RepID=UPI00131EC736|nr:exodeoxyribonuclease VII large subunit [Thaumasiovibrio occultus]
MQDLASKTSDLHDSGTMTLTELLTEVGQVLRREMQSRYWFTAELTSVKRHTSGHTYLELSHTNDGGQTAKTQANLWAQNAQIIRDFEQQTGIRFDKNLEVMLLGEVTFSPQYGFKLNIVGINASFSVGAFELKLREIRKRLQDLGESERNKQLPVPLDFTRVAVIAPAKAAGLSDFKTKAERLQQHGLCQFDYFEATFQGPRREDSIVMAFSEVVQNAHTYDAVCFIRGGGDRAGLNELAEAKLARAVCRCPYPVFTGIGHQTDHNLLDEYAHASFSTPSMVVSYINDTIVNNAKAAKENFVAIQHVARQTCNYAKQDVAHKWSGICEDKAIILSTWRHNVSTLTERVFTSSKQAVADSRFQVAQHYNVMMGSTRYTISQQKEAVKTLHDENRHHSTRHVTAARQANRDLANLMYTSASKQITKNQFELEYRFKHVQQQAKAQSHAAKQELAHGMKLALNGAQRSLSAQRESVTNTFKLIDAVNPQNVLARGFALITTPNGEVVKGVSQLNPNETVTVQLKDGSFTATPNNIDVKGNSNE